MDFLKEILGEELYSQVDEKVKSYNSDEKNKNNQVKIVNIAAGNYVGKEKFEAKETELAGIKQQLTDANATIKTYEDMDIDSIKQATKDWEQKYNTDTKALQEKLEKQNYNNKVEKIVDGLKFTSTAAKKAFISDLNEKELKLENDNLLGFDDFVKSYKESDPEAFVKEDSNQKPKPEFGSTTQGEPEGASELDDFMSVMGITKKE